MQDLMPLSVRASRNQSASWPRSAISQSALGKLLSMARAPVWSLTWLGCQEKLDGPSIPVGNSVELSVEAVLRAPDEAAFLRRWHPF